MESKSYTRLIHQSQWVTWLLDILLLPCALLLGFFLLSDFVLHQNTIDLYLHLVPAIILFQLFLFWILGVYRSIWRYSGPSDLLLILQAIVLHTLLGILWQISVRTYLVSPRLIEMFYGIVTPVSTFLFIGYQPDQLCIPYSVLILNGIMSFLLIGGIRTLGRLWVEAKRKEVSPAIKRLLIIGSGNESEGILREMRRNPALPYRPIGIITDNSSRIGLRIHGVKILGQINDIPRIIEQHRVEEILIALPSHSQKTVRQIVSLCEPVQIKIRTLPSMEDLIEGKIRLNQFPVIRPEDILGREQIQINTESIAAYISNRSILVTGAGGSIGSELCRQVGGFNPARLILLGRGENSIYEIENELRHRFPEVPLVPVIADVRDKSRLEQIFSKYQPEVVFHAAAHKHVPLMELNPWEAVKNNVIGTLNLVQAAITNHTERFILISTDKAIRPANIMGASKRVAELIVESYASESQTHFAIVQFGNVLGSRGSVIPLFQKQILWGGPITITHPDVTRYFMSIPEAVKLVIQSGSMANHGEIFALDMGEPVNITDVARNLITLAGLEPDTDIEITYTGLRPGEKLSEISPTAETGAQKTSFPDIFQIPPDKINKPTLLSELASLQKEMDTESDASSTLVLERLIQLIARATDNNAKN